MTDHPPRPACALGVDGRDMGLGPKIMARQVLHVSTSERTQKKTLVGDFNPSEKYESIGMIIPNIWKNESHVPNHQPEVACNKLKMLIGFTFAASVKAPQNTPGFNHLQPRGAGRITSRTSKRAAPGAATAAWMRTGTTRWGVEHQ